ncbi:MAG: DUF4240 domain-containing protein [Planctomycetaceae bacterium]
MTGRSRSSLRGSTGNSSTITRRVIQVTAAEFWNIIACSSEGASGIRQQESRLRRLLMKLDPDQIVSFNEWFGRFVREAFLYRLWGAAWLIGDGCSDDGFWDFRCWLVARGEHTYRRALDDPDSLSEVVTGKARLSALSFSNPAMFVWAEKLGKNESDLDEFPQSWGSNPGETPSDEPFLEDGGYLRERYPKLWKVVKE